MPFRTRRRSALQCPAPCWQYPPALLWLLAIVAIAVAGCESKTTSEVTTGPTPPKCQLAVAGPPNVVSDGGTGNVSVTAQPECAWTVSTEASWLSEFSPASGQGNGTVAFRAAPNPVPSMREGEIVINDSRVRVMQEAAPCRFALEPEAQTVAASASNASVSVSVLNGCAWTARSNAEWLTVTSAANGNGSGTVTFRVAANGGGPRTGTLTIGERTHTVSQQQATQNPPAPAPAPPPPAPTPPPPAPTPPPPAPTPPPPAPTPPPPAPTPPPPAPTPPPPACTYQINPTSASVTAIGGTGSIGVTAAAGCSWTASTSASWISFPAGASGSGNGTVGYLVLPNVGTARSSTISIAGLTFTLNQAAPLPNCTYTLNPGGATVPAAGGTGSFTVTASSGCAWTAVASAPWITVTSGAAGNGNGTVAFTVAANSGASRSGSIVVAGQTFTVTQ